MTGQDEGLRVIVAVTRDGHPELYDELRRVPAKFRAERLRTLATMALQGAAAQAPRMTAPASGAITQGQEHSAPQKPAEPIMSEEELRAAREAEELARRKDEMKQALRKGF